MASSSPPFSLAPQRLVVFTLQPPGHAPGDGGGEDDGARAELAFANTSASPLAFKVKTTAPKRCV